MKKPMRSRVVCVLTTGEYYYGDPEPKNASYLEWHAWADAQSKRRRRPKSKVRTQDAASGETASDRSSIQRAREK